MNNESLRKEALWLNTVLMGLALKEAVVPVLSHLIEPPSGNRSDHAEEGFRLLVFVLFVIRYWLGSNHYFDRVYGNDQSSVGGGAHRSQDFLGDFLFGIGKFSIFTAIALSIQTHSGSSGVQTVFRQMCFLGGLWLLLIYDLLFIASKSWKPLIFGKLRYYLFSNSLFVGLSIAVFFATGGLFQYFSGEFAIAAAEFVALLILLLFCVAELVNEWLAEEIRFVPKPLM